MWEQLRFILDRIREKLWVKPLLICALSIGAVFLAELVDTAGLERFVPAITRESIEYLLKTMASSMLMMATFAVASMVAAFASASRAATPRAFPLVVGDGLSQNTLSAFIGAFIYSVVALLALMNGYFSEKAGQFFLFILTIFVLAMIIIMFIRWVDSIARLGRVVHTIDVVEKTAADAIRKRQKAPHLGCVAAELPPADGSKEIVGKCIGYLQRIDAEALQKRATASKLKIHVAALPGTFCAPNRPLAWVVAEAPGRVSDEDSEAIADAFVLGDSRIFDQDPRFGLVVLSEIASRALSPAVNDPGTAIDVTGRFVRLFVTWHECSKPHESCQVNFDRVAAPELCLADAFDDAFTGTARDGASMVEVVVRLLKALEALSAMGKGEMRENALRHARLALVRAETALNAPEDLLAVREAAKFAE